MPNASLSSHSRIHRRGFTLIEMLVVIGIILLLIGISIAGFNSIARHAKAQHTKAAIETAKAMLSEYEASAGKTNVSSFAGYWDNVTNPIPSKNGRQAPLTIATKPAPTPYTWDVYSALVLSKLLEVPTNKAILDKLPSDQVQKTLQIPAGSGNYYYEILDGYGHPLLFCPSVGLSFVTAGGIPGATNRILQSDGVFHTPAGPPVANPRYFWMSAGADNDPAGGDDNHYSFEQ